MSHAVFPQATRPSAGADPSAFRHPVTRVLAFSQGRLPARPDNLSARSLLHGSDCLHHLPGVASVVSESTGLCRPQIRRIRYSGLSVTHFRTAKYPIKKARIRQRRTAVFAIRAFWCRSRMFCRSAKDPVLQCCGTAVLPTSLKSPRTFQPWQGCRR